VTDGTTLPIRPWLFALRRSWLLILLFGMVGVLAGFLVSTREEVTYTATALISLGSADTTSGTDSTALADTARALATSQSQVAAAAKGLGRDPEHVTQNITVSAIGTSGIIEISVRDTDPKVAAQLANNLGQGVVRSRQQSIAPPGDIESQLDGIDAQLSKLDGQIASLDVQLQAVQAGIGSGNLQAQSLQAQIIADRLSELSSQRSILVQQRISIQDRQPLLPRNPAIVDAAMAPSKPDVSRIPGEIALGALAGVLIGVMLALGRVASMPSPPRPAYREATREAEEPARAVEWPRT
jgi:uncharacterized protein involved in exopolysaccharide biosynthesis